MNYGPPWTQSMCSAVSYERSTSLSYDKTLICGARREEILV